MMIAELISDIPANKNNLNWSKVRGTDNIRPHKFAKISYVQRGRIEMTGTGFQLLK